MEELIFNLLSNKELSPSLKITLIGIEKVKELNEDGSITINLNRITSLTAINNRTLRRNIKVLVEKEIVKQEYPNEEGKTRTLWILPLYNELLSTNYPLELDSLSNEQTEPSLDNLSSKEIKNKSMLDNLSNGIKDFIIKLSPTELNKKISDTDICRNSLIVDLCRNHIKDNNDELPWNDMNIDFIDSDKGYKCLAVNDGGKTKFIVKDML